MASKKGNPHKSNHKVFQPRNALYQWCCFGASSKKTTSPFFPASLTSRRIKTAPLAELKLTHPAIGTRTDGNGNTSRSGNGSSKGWSTPRSGPSPSNLVYKSLMQHFVEVEEVSWYNFTTSKRIQDS